MEHSREMGVSSHTPRGLPVDHSEKQHHVQLSEAGENLPGAPESAVNNDDDSDDHDSSTQEVGGKQRSLLQIIFPFFAAVNIPTKPGLPPDGGKLAWGQAIAGHLIVFNTWGYVGSFGIFQTYYVGMLGRSPSEISWIGSFQIFLVFFIGVIAGRLSDAGYFRQMIALGVALQMVGIFTTSVATQYWQLFLAQGLCMGLGSGCLFCPALAVVSTYFSKRRALAIGIMSSGTGTGGLVFPTIARQLLPTIGFGWTMRTMAFVQLVTLGVAFIVLKPRVPPRVSGSFFDFSAFKELEYAFYVCGSFCCFLGVYFAYYYIASFGRDVIGLSYVDGLNLLLVLNGVGITGRLVPNFLADRFGPITILIPVTAVSAIIMLLWMVVGNAVGLYVWVVFYGTFAGGLTGLIPAGLSSLTTDLQKAGVRLGTMFTIVSFAALAGPPIAGQIISASGGRYFGADLFAGIALLMGSVFYAAAKWAKCRKAEGISFLRSRV